MPTISFKFPNKTRFCHSCAGRKHSQRQSYMIPAGAYAREAERMYNTL